MNRGIGRAWLVLALSSCAQSIEPIESSEMAITGGAKESGYPSVFSLAFDGQGMCTGTCVTPHVGLTAAHCVWGEDAAHLSALFGDSEEEPALVIDAVAVETADDDADIAMVAFAGACPAATPFRREGLEPFVGDPVVMVGYGVTSEYGDDFGLKRSGVATLYSIDPEDVNGLEEGELATSNDPAGTCYGDSGGPTFMTFEDGVEVVVGVTSRGSLDAFGREEPCGSGVSIAVRADSHAAFLDDFVARYEPDPPADGDVDPDDDDDPPDPDGDGPTGDELPGYEPLFPEGDAEEEPMQETRGGHVRGGGCSAIPAPGDLGPGLVLLGLVPALRRRARAHQLRSSIS
jgi:hypothetical protein